MESKSGLALNVLLTIVALLVGLYGIVILIGAGEGANSVVVAFATVSIPFALLAGLFSFIAPGARWPIAGAVAAPVAILSLASSWSSRYLLVGALWTVVLACAGAYAGARIRMARSRSQKPPS